MNNYLIKFFGNGETTFVKPRPQADKTVKFIDGQITEVSHDEVFLWMEKSKREGIKMLVYKCECICDLS